MQTPWDYTVEELPPILSVADFKSLYPTMSSTDDEIESVLCATSQAIRDYCGWHVSPELECTFTGDGEGSILVLPAMGVTEVESLTINGVDTPCEFRSSGLVRINGRFPDAWRSVECTYTAGFPADSLAQVVGQIAANALVAAPGVANERAGNVSITYNMTGNGITGGVSLLPRDYALLAPYKLARAW